MKDCNYRPTGELQGDTRPMPDRGTGTGLNGDTYGASLDQGATNSRGRIGRDAMSDAMDRCTADNPIMKK